MASIAFYGSHNAAAAVEKNSIHQLHQFVDWKMCPPISSLKEKAD